MPISAFRLLGASALSSILLLALPVAQSAAPAKPAPGTLVIVFKDGHRQVFNLADVARVEFPTGDQAGQAAYNPLAPSRGRFLGKWQVGDGQGRNFYITLEENGDAFRSLGDVHGKWAYVDGEAQITWDDSAQDAIRKVGSGYRKFAYEAGKAFTDTPANVTNARNTSPKPI